MENILETENQYTKITEYYDLLVTSGYYDYQNIASVGYSILGHGRQVLELGVGTGLLAEKYIEIDPDCEFTGIDFTASMLEIAQERLGDKVKLIEADVVTMNLGTKFDAAISNGGVWVAYNCGEYWEVGTLIPNLEANFTGLVNVADHLQKGGLLLLNVQQPHENSDISLPFGIVYSQSVKELKNTMNYRILEKSYFFKKDGEVVAQDHHKITFFNQDAYQSLFRDAGFEFVDISPSSKGDCFAIYRRR